MVLRSAEFEKTEKVSVFSYFEKLIFFLLSVR